MEFLFAFGVRERSVTPRQHIAAARRSDRDAWAVPKPGYNNPASRQDRIGSLEKLYMVVVDASVLDSR